MSETVLLTGAAGMIGVRAVQGLLASGKKVIGLDLKESPVREENYTHVIADLADPAAVKHIFDVYGADRVIHLAALAHAAGTSAFSKDDYYRANVLCADHVFDAAAEKSIPVLFISTADVYGFVKGIATPQSVPHPVTVYGKTKYLAEQKLKTRCSRYDIFRFAPVYTDEIKRDIQKRYYFRYPDWAYIIGGGMDYEFLYIDTAVRRMVAWCDEAPSETIYNIKNAELINTAECLKEERAAGRAKHILHFPQWLIHFGFGVLCCLTGKNKYTYLLNKAVHPLRTE